MKLIVKILVVLLLASPCWGDSYYIDFTGGANTNNGTATGTAWKSHPYMQTAAACSGTGAAPSYSHSAGDIFYFKGGETWPAECWSMNIGAGGSAGNIDTYTVDASWYTGGSWTRPVFDGEWVSPSNNSMIRTLGNSYITFNNLELKDMQNETAGGSSFIIIDGGSNIIIQNTYMHGWYLKDGITSDDAHGGVYAGNNSSVTIDSCTISNSEYSETRNSGVAIKGANIVTNTTINNVPSVCLGCTNVSYSTIYNISYPTVDFDVSYHTNGIYQVGSGSVHHNLIYNFSANAAPLYPNVCSAGSGNCKDWTQYVYDNVVIIPSDDATVPHLIDISTEAADAGPVYGGTIYVYNNTLVNPQYSSSIRYPVWDGRITIDVADIRNNHIINSDGSGGIGGTAQTETVSNNLVQALATAASDGYNAGAYHIPTLGSEAGIDAGADVSGTVTDDINSVSRPQGSAHDIGAYEYGSPTNTITGVTIGNLEATEALISWNRSDGLR